MSSYRFACSVVAIATMLAITHPALADQFKQVADGGTIGCAVSANTFTIVKKDALRIGPNSSRITVTGNNFSNSYIGEGSQKRQKVDSEAAGIVLAGTSDIAISGNSFAGLTTKAVVIEGEAPKRVLFTNNVLTEVTSEHGKLDREAVHNNLE